MNDVFGALQATLGGIYINNFNLFGRVWQVNIQGDAADRNDVTSLWQIYIRNKYGADVPLRSIADARVVGRTASDHPLQQLSRDPDQGRPLAGDVVRRGARSNGSRSAADPPAGYGYEWTGTAYQEVAASGQTGQSSAWPSCLRFCFSSASTRAG